MRSRLSYQFGLVRRSGHETHRRRGKSFKFSSSSKRRPLAPLSIAAVQALAPSAFAMSPKVAFLASLTWHVANTQKSALL